MDVPKRYWRRNWLQLQNDKSQAAVSVAQLEQIEYIIQRKGGWLMNILFD